MVYKRIKESLKTAMESAKAPLAGLALLAATGCATHHHHHHASTQSSGQDYWVNIHDKAFDNCPGYNKMSACNRGELRIPLNDGSNFCVTDRRCYEDIVENTCPSGMISAREHGTGWVRCSHPQTLEIHSRRHLGDTYHHRGHHTREGPRFHYSIQQEEIIIQQNHGFHRGYSGHKPYSGGHRGSRPVQSRQPTREIPRTRQPTREPVRRQPGERLRDINQRQRQR